MLLHILCIGNPTCAKQAPATHSSSWSPSDYRTYEQHELPITEDNLRPKIIKVNGEEDANENDLNSRKRNLQAERIVLVHLIAIEELFSHLSLSLVTFIFSSLSLFLSLYF